MNSMKQYIIWLSALMLNIFVVCSKPISSFQKSCEIILDRIAMDNISSIGNIKILEKNVSKYMSDITREGSFPDVDYFRILRTNWNAQLHLDRIYQMSIAYVTQGGCFYKDEQLYKTIVSALEYWDKVRPRCDNWWNNQVGTPRTMGKILVILRKGEKKLPFDLENRLLEHIRRTGGNPADANRTGANKADIALHWLCRGCLQQDKKTVDIAMHEAFVPAAYTTEEGIQHDNSYFQHGHQLYIGGYASVLLNRIVEMAWYTIGTDYRLSDEQLDILSKFIRETYLKCVRGRYMCYNVMGRGVSRQGALMELSSVKMLEKLKDIDKEYAGDYENAIISLRGKSEKSHSIQSSLNHYYIGDFSLFHNNDYSFGVRMVSERTQRSEEGNGENIKGYFLSDGSTMIAIEGDEYADIFPVWDWYKVPGVTTPCMSSIPRMEKQWTHHGESDFVGGVTDGKIGVSTYKMNNKSDGVDLSANKSWFFFGKEIVCLGSNISTPDNIPVVTTLNQCLLDSDVYYSVNGKIKVLEKNGSVSDFKPDWILHDKIGYFFPTSQHVNLKAEHRTGRWSDINIGQSKDLVSKDVFCTWINHGVSPRHATYDYVIVPNIGYVKQMQKYDLSALEIVENSDSIQAVRHKKAKISQIVFYKGGSISIGKVKLTVDKGCIIMLNKKNKLLFVSDPSHKLNTLTIKLCSKEKNSNFVVDFSNDGLHKGKTHCLKL